jgi:hypothetical protein
MKQGDWPDSSESGSSSHLIEYIPLLRQQPFISKY